MQQGDVQLRVAARGLLNATHTFPVTAPPVAGAMLQILRLYRTGDAVKGGDVVLEFDTSQQQYDLEQSRNELEQAEQEIVKAMADAQVQTAQDKTALLKARFAVRRAELDVSKSEILSEIDAKKNALTLEEARRALAQLEQDIRSHSNSNKAALMVSQEKHKRAELAMKQAQQNIEDMRVKSPAAGILVVHGNDRATGGITLGMTPPDYQAGDQVGPGSTLAQVVDVQAMEVAAQVDERERPLLRVGQNAQIQIDVLPGESFAGKITSISGAANQNFWDSGSQVKFGVTIHLDRTDARLRPGLTARVILLGNQLSHVSWIPAQAVFDRGDKRVVYVGHRGAWNPQEVRVRAYTEGRVVIEGVTPGSTVALADPENSGQQVTPAKGASSPVGPGR